MKLSQLESRFVDFEKLPFYTRHKVKLLRAFILSLIVHGIAFWCLTLIPDEATVIPKDAVDNYVEFDDKAKETPPDAKAFVRKAQIPKELLSSDENVKRRFLSEDKQTVLEETRAAESGLTENRSLTMNEKNNDGLIATGDGLGIRGSDAVSDDGYGETQAGNGGVGDKGKNLKFPDMRRFGLEAGRSTFGDHAPNDLKIGEMTALNTDRFLYYSFYARAEELVYHHWAKYVQAVLYSYQQTGAATGDEYWITKVEIVLDKNGNFLKGLIHQGSGLQGLDLAPVHAFQDAAMVPNPPQEMVQSDGTIRMDWEFEVKVQSQIAGTN
jgi:hypothetical protein